MKAKYRIVAAVTVVIAAVMAIAITFTSPGENKPHANMPKGSSSGGGASVYPGRQTIPTPTSTPTPTPGPTDANLFIDKTTSGNTCTRSATAIPYSSNNACDDFNAAYQAGHQGDNVLVKVGTYVAQTINDDATKHTGVCDVGNTSPCVKFGVYGSDVVTLADLTNHAWNTYYDGFTFTKTPTTGNPSDGGPSVTQGTGVVMANMDATQFYIQSQSSTNPVVNAHIYGGTFGPLVTCPGGGMVIGTDSATQSWEMPKNVTIEGVSGHDFKITSGCGADHMDCVHARQTTGFFRFLRNRFYNCQNYALLLEGSPDASWSLIIANNMIGDSIAGPSSLAYHGGAPTDDFPGTQSIVNNSTSEGLGPQPGSNITGSLTVANNYASTHNSCKTGTYSANFLSGSTGCDASDTLNTTFTWVNRSTGDMHLTGSAQPGNATYCPATDFDGQARATCYVGADTP